MGSSRDHNTKIVHLYADDSRHQAHTATTGGSIDSIALAEDWLALATHWIDRYLAEWYEVHPIDDVRREKLVTMMSGNDRVLRDVRQAYQDLRDGTQCVQVLTRFQPGQEQRLQQLLNSISAVIARNVKSPGLL